MTKQQMQILISAKDQATKVLNGVSKTVQKVGKTAKKMGKGFGNVLVNLGKKLLSFKTALVGVAGVAGMGLLIKSSVESIDKLGKVSQKLGVTSQELQRFRYSAKLAGVEQSALDMGLQRFIRRVGEASKGTGEAKDALAQMGIKLTDSSGRIRSATDLLGQVSNALSKTKDPAERLRLAFKLFDSEGVAMVNMLKGGKEALTATMMEADKLGLVLSDKVVNNAQRVNDVFYKLTSSIGGVKNNLVGALLPSLERFGSWWTEFTASFSSTIQPLWLWLEQHLASISTSFGSATEVGKEWGRVIGYETVELIKKITDFFTKVEDGKTQFQEFKETAKKAFGDAVYVIRSVGSAIKFVVDWVTKAINGLRALYSLMSGGGLAQASAIAQGRSLTGTRASGGGVMANQPYLVGERGAEVFTPSTAGSISSSAGGTTQVTNIYTNATAHGINNALGSRTDNVNRGTRVGMSVSRASGFGGYGNLSMARSR